MHWTFVVVAQAIVEVEFFGDLPAILTIERKRIDEHLPLRIALNNAGSRWIQATRQEVSQEQNIGSPDRSCRYPRFASNAMNNVGFDETLRVSTGPALSVLQGVTGN